MSYHEEFRDELSDLNTRYAEVTENQWNNNILTPFVTCTLTGLMFVILYYYRLLTRQLLLKFKPHGPLADTFAKRMINRFWKIFYSGNLYYVDETFKKDKNAPRINIYRNLLKYNDHDYHNYCNKCNIFGHSMESQDHYVSQEAILTATLYKMYNAKLFNTQPIRNHGYNVSHVTPFMNNPELFIEKTNLQNLVIQNQPLPTAFAVAKLSEIEALESLEITIQNKLYKIYVNNTREIPHLFFFSYVDQESLNNLTLELSMNYNQILYKSNEIKQTNQYSKITIYTQDHVDNTYFTYLALSGMKLIFAKNVDLMEMTKTALYGKNRRHNNTQQSTTTDSVNASANTDSNNANSATTADSGNFDDDTSASEITDADSVNNIVIGNRKPKIDHFTKAQLRHRQAKIDRKHEHNCVKCGVNYTHYHARNHDGEHKQFPNQCPNEDCTWYHNGYNPTNSTLMENSIANSSNVTKTTVAPKPATKITLVKSTVKPALTKQMLQQNDEQTAPLTPMEIYARRQFYHDLKTVHDENEPNNLAESVNRMENSLEKQQPTQITNPVENLTPAFARSKNGGNVSGTFAQNNLMNKTLLFTTLIACFLPIAQPICHNYRPVNSEPRLVGLDSGFDFSTPRCINNRNTTGTMVEKYYNGMLNGNCFSYENGPLKKLSQFANNYPTQNLDDLQSFDFTQQTQLGNTVYDYVYDSKLVNTGYVMLFIENTQLYFDLFAQTNDMKIINYFGQPLEQNNEKYAYMTEPQYYAALKTALNNNRTGDHLVFVDNLSNYDEIDCQLPTCIYYEIPKQTTPSLTVHIMGKLTKKIKHAQTGTKLDINTQCVEICDCEYYDIEQPIHNTEQQKQTTNQQLHNYDAEFYSQNEFFKQYRTSIVDTFVYGSFTTRDHIINGRFTFSNTEYPCFDKIDNDKCLFTPGKTNITKCYNQNGFEMQCGAQDTDCIAYQGEFCIENDDQIENDLNTDSNVVLPLVTEAQELVVQHIDQTPNPANKNKQIVADGKPILSNNINCDRSLKYFGKLNKRVYHLVSNNKTHVKNLIDSLKQYLEYCNDDEIIEDHGIYSNNAIHVVENLQDFDDASITELCKNIQYRFVFTTIFENFTTNSSKHTTRLEQLQQEQQTRYITYNKQCFDTINGKTIFIGIPTKLHTTENTSGRTIIDEFINTVYYQSKPKIEKLHETIGNGTEKLHQTFKNGTNNAKTRFNNLLQKLTFLTSYVSNKTSETLGMIFNTCDGGLYYTLNSYEHESIGPDYFRRIYQCGNRDMDFCTLLNHPDTAKLYKQCVSEMLTNINITIYKPYTQSNRDIGFEIENLNLTTQNFEQMYSAFGYEYNGQRYMYNRKLFYIPGEYTTAYYDPLARLTCKSNTTKPFTAYTTHSCILAKYQYHWMNVVSHSVRDPVVMFGTFIGIVFLCIVAYYAYDNVYTAFIRATLIAIDVFIVPNLHMSINYAGGLFINAFFGIMNFISFQIIADVDFTLLRIFSVVIWLVLNLHTYFLLYTYITCEYRGFGRMRDYEFPLRFLRALFMIWETIYIVFHIIIPFLGNISPFYICTFIATCALCAYMLTRLFCKRKNIWERAILKYRDAALYLGDMREKYDRKTNDELKLFCQTKIKQATITDPESIKWDEIKNFSFIINSIRDTNPAHCGDLNAEFVPENPTIQTLTTRYGIGTSFSSNQGYAIENQNTNLNPGHRFEIPTVNAENFIRVSFNDPHGKDSGALNAPIVDSILRLERHIFGNDLQTFTRNYDNGNGLKHLSLSTPRERFDFDNHKLNKTIIEIPLIKTDLTTHYARNPNPLNHRAKISCYRRLIGANAPWIFGFADTGATDIPSSAGDCGSLYFDNIGRLLGMHCAGSRNTQYRRPKHNNEKHEDRPKNIWSLYNWSINHPLSYFITLESETGISVDDDVKDYDFTPTQCYRICPPCDPYAVLQTLHYLTNGKDQTHKYEYDIGLFNDFGITRDYFDNYPNFNIYYNDFVKNFEKYTTTIIAGNSFETCMQNGVPQNILDTIKQQPIEIKQQSTTKSSKTILGSFGLWLTVILNATIILTLLYIDIPLGQYWKIYTCENHVLTNAALIFVRIATYTALWLLSAYLLRSTNVTRSVCILFLMTSSLLLAILQFATTIYEHKYCEERLYIDIVGYVFDYENKNSTLNMLLFIRVIILFVITLYIVYICYKIMQKDRDTLLENQKFLVYKDVCEKLYLNVGPTQSIRNFSNMCFDGYHEFKRFENATHSFIGLHFAYYSTSWFLINVFPIFTLIRLIKHRNRYYFTYFMLQLITRGFGCYLHHIFQQNIFDDGIGSPTHDSRQQTLLVYTLTYYIIEYVIAELFHPNAKLETRTKLIFIACSTALRFLIHSAIIVAFVFGYLRDDSIPEFVIGLFGGYYAVYSLYYSLFVGENRFYWFIRVLIQTMTCIFYVANLMVARELYPENYLTIYALTFIIQTIDIAMWEASRPTGNNLLDYAMKRCGLSNQALTQTQTKLEKSLGTTRNLCAYLANSLKVIKPDPVFRDLGDLVNEVDNLWAAWNEDTSPAIFDKLVDRFIDMYPALFAIAQNDEISGQLGMIISFIRDDGTFDFSRFEQQLGEQELHQRAANLQNQLINSDLCAFIKNHKLNIDNLSNDVVKNSALDLFNILSSRLHDYSVENRQFMVDLAVRATENLEQIRLNPYEESDLCDLQTEYLKLRELLDQMTNNTDIPMEKELRRGYNCNIDMLRSILSKFQKTINVKTDAERQRVREEQKQIQKAAAETQQQQARIKRIQKQNAAVAMALASWVNLAAINKHLRDQKNFVENQSMTNGEFAKQAATKIYNGILKNSTTAENDPIHVLTKFIDVLIEKQFITRDFGHGILDDVIENNDVINESIRDALWTGSDWSIIPAMCGQQKFSCGEDHRHGLFACLSSLSDKWYAHSNSCSSCLAYYKKRQHPHCGKTYDIQSDIWQFNKQPNLQSFANRYRSCVACTYCKDCITGYRSPSCDNAYYHIVDHKTPSHKLENESFNVCALPKLDTATIVRSVGQTQIKADGYIAPLVMRTTTKLDKAPTYYRFVPNPRDGNGFYYVHTTMTNSTDITALINRLHKDSLENITNQSLVFQPIPLVAQKQCGQDFDLMLQKRGEQIEKQLVKMKNECAIVTYDNLTIDENIDSDKFKTRHGILVFARPGDCPHGVQLDAAEMVEKLKKYTNLPIHVIIGNHTFTAPLKFQLNSKTGVNLTHGLSTYVKTRAETDNAVKAIVTFMNNFSDVINDDQNGQVFRYTGTL